MILSVGELLIDFIGSTEEGFVPFPGGSPYNTAIAMGRLGAPTEFFSRISTDMFGQQLVSHLRAQKVGISYAPRSKDPTILSFIKMEAGGKPEYAFFANGCADRMMQPSDLPFPLPKEVQAVQIGSISLVLEPGASSIVGFIEKVHSSVVVSYDPNIRASLIPDHAAYAQRFEKLVGMSDIIKLSDEDLYWLYPGLTWEQGVDKILQLGTTLVALTRGEGGAVLTTAQTRVEQPMVSFGLADTVGAGDTFHGALLAYLYDHELLTKEQIRQLSHDQLQSAGAYATQAAGINCSRKGADPPWKKEMV